MRPSSEVVCPSRTAGEPQIHADEKVATCAGFPPARLRSSTRTASPASSGVLTDNAWAYRKGLAWKQALAEIGAPGKLTRAYRPQRNGKVEGFTYNYHRCHTAPGGQPPISRVNNPAGQYT